MLKTNINAMSFCDKTMLNSYLEMNNIDGIFLCKNDKVYEVLEGKADYCGFVAGEFTFKREAITFIDKWCKHTGLKRFKNFNC